MLRPGYKEALLNRGQLLFDKGKREEALENFDFCDNTLSGPRALETLYLLGQVKDIYKRIETQPEVDDENIRIAAIASFLNKREKKIPHIIFVKTR